MLTHQPFTSEEACSAKYRRPVLLSVGFHGSLHDVCTCTVLVCVCVCVRYVRCVAELDKTVRASGGASVPFTPRVQSGVRSFLH